MNKEYALIVAGGSGNRMKSHIPKQFIEIGKLPVLMRTIKVFNDYSSFIQIILVLPKEQFPVWKQLCDKYNFSVAHELVEGGISRQDSVKKGLERVGNSGFVAIHDGVRPFVNVKIIQEGFAVAYKKGNAVATVSLKDSIRYVSAEENKAVNRNDFRIVQTPQTFSVSQIKNAYETCVGEFTDDASVAECAGYSIHLIEGSYDNIKITTTEDLDYAEAIIKRAGKEGNLI